MPRKSDERSNGEVLSTVIRNINGLNKLIQEKKQYGNMTILELQTITMACSQTKKDLTRLAKTAQETLNGKIEKQGELEND